MSAVTAPEAAGTEEEQAPELLKLLGTLPLMLLSLFWSAVVFLWLWRWFVVPLGVRDITFWSSLGLLLVVGFFKSNAHEAGGRRGAVYWAKYVRREIAYSVCFLGVGWLIHLAAR